MSENEKTSQENKNPEKKEFTYEVTAEGSLGLLALGAVGIRAWRKKRDEKNAPLKKDKNE